MFDVPAEALGFVSAHKRFLISTHVNPDGDGIGSAMGLKWALVRLGKEAEIVIESDPPAMYDFFGNYGWVKGIGPATAPLEKFDTVITVDAPNIERLGKAAQLIAGGAKVMVIDHHVSNEKFGDVNYIDETAAASAEMIYRFVRALGLTPDRDCAEYLYSGILIDTGRFRFSNTSPEVLRAGADLVAAGARPHKIAERLFFTNTFETTKGLGKMIESIQLHAGGKVATAEFGLEYINSEEWKKVDTEGFVNHPLAIEGVEVAVFFKEVKPGVTRASLRAKNDFDVNAVAGIFGGGGHAKAAGCTINAPLEEAKKKLLGEIAKAL
ncbi:MAG: bifunctional oligoribonuclease/PAP phosphatase NrnA [Nitrospinae bacterium]|nr:bifunctional oligoribonuclease/PAP phosphatase NrnA [Nitrospinota bacterium]